MKLQNREDTEMAIDSISTESSMENDLFFDLFGENGILTPDSSGSLTDHDSGIGSPFGSSVDDLSPLQFPHEDNELWESILDDLPNDIADDESDSNGEHYQGISDSITDISWYNKNGESPVSLVNVNSVMNTSQVPMNWDLLSKSIDFSSDQQQQACTVSSESLISSDLNEAVNLNSSTDILMAALDALKNQKEPSSKVAKLLTAKNKQINDVGPSATPIAQDSDMDLILSNILGKTKSSLVSPQKDVGAHVSVDHDYANKELLLSSPVFSPSGMNAGVKLTDEEKKLLERERMVLPENLPLTKDEEKVLKKVRRKIKNKQSAMESRQRRKDYMYNLENRVKHCTNVNNDLNKKVDQLTKENKTLRNELNFMKEYCKSIQQSRTINPGTCLAVVMLSFALLVLPFNPLQHFGGKSDNAADSPTGTTFRSRTLLSIPSNEESYQDTDPGIKSIHSSDLDQNNLRLSKLIQLENLEPMRYHFKSTVSLGSNLTLVIGNYSAAYLNSY